MKKRPVRVGVIAAAGKGTRAYPRTSFIPKPLFRFEGQTILERNAELMFKTLGVNRLYIIVGHLQELVVEEVEHIRKKYPDKTIEVSFWTKKGLASDIAVLRNVIREEFAVILGDEFYYNTDHASLLKAWRDHEKAQALIAVWKADLIATIRKNYSVELDGERVLNLIEKPQNPPNSLAGLGTYFFTREFFDFFDKTPPSKRSNVVELTDVIDLMARLTQQTYAHEVGGRYFNINSLADYYSVYYFIRSEQFKKYKISLVIPARNNASTLPDVISDFKPVVDEIIVVDMGSADETPALARKARVRLIEAHSETPGPHDGRAIYDAMSGASGDIVVLATADGCFRARDLPKLLEYLKDCDMAVGTRTTRQMIEQGSNLKSLYRWLNVGLGKLVEIFWWGQEPRYTDIGCVYRAVWKDSFNRIAGDLHARDRTYSLEMMIEIMRYHMRCIEVPVSYYQRYGYAPDETKGQLVRYFFSTLALIFSRRFRFVDRLFRLFSRDDQPEGKNLA